MQTATLLRTPDFELSGSGMADVWRRNEWLPLKRTEGASNHGTRFKMAHSQSGIYVLVDCEDDELTCRQRDDYDDLWVEDAVELFFWPDERLPVYLQHVISPLGAELTLLVPNATGKHFGWRPWHAERRKTRRATSVRGGARAPLAAVQGWTVEAFVPFSLFLGVTDVPPAEGTSWRANVFRVDYQKGAASRWAWCEDAKSTHDFKGYGAIVFGR